MAKSRKGQKWTIARKETCQRMNKARRLWKKAPLFAVAEMRRQYPEYSEDQLTQDLRRRTPATKKRGKSGLNRYGRYQQINDLMHKYAQTGDITFAIVASKLRQKITKPYHLMLHIAGSVREYSYPSTISYKLMMNFYQKARKCTTWTAFEELEKEQLRYAHIG